MFDANTDILVVDDFATMRRIIKMALKQIGIKTVFEADDGSTALEVLKKQRVDLIISDWNMPRMSGLELLKAVRNNESMKKIPFLMVTAEAQKEFVIEAVKAGVNDYLVKPFTQDALKKKLEKIFKG